MIFNKDQNQLTLDHMCVNIQMDTVSIRIGMEMLLELLGPM